MHLLKNLIPFILILIISCSKPQEIEPQISYNGHYKIGTPYKINDNWYYPKKDDNHVETGQASWYGGNDGFHGKKTANGDFYDKNALTAAHRTLPLPSVIKVTNLSNSKSVILMINDRGPFSKKRVLDVSERAATILGMKQKGFAKVKVELLADKTTELLKQLAMPAREGARTQKSKKVAEDFIALANNIDTQVIKDDQKTGQKKLYIQAGTFKHRNHAVSTVKKLAKLAKANINEVIINKKQHYRVTLGPVINTNKANNMLKEIIKLGINEAIIVASN